MKEIRAFIVDTGDERLPDNMSGYLIDDWADTPENEELDDDAKLFISIAEEDDHVYSIKGLMVAFNINEEVSLNDYIFITNKY